MKEIRRLRILAIAYACNPTKGSEYGVGWGWTNAIAADHQLTVVTADFYRDEIERYRNDNEAEHTRENPRFIYVKNRPWHYRPSGMWLKIEDSPAKFIMNLTYQNWLKYAYSVAKYETAQNEYDVVHLITFVGWRFPGKFYKLGTPFVWGPIGGLKNTPWNLFPALGIRGAIYYGGRNIINSLQIRFLPGPKRALRRARGAVIAATSEIQQSLKEHFGTESHVICEVGLPEVGAEINPQQRAINKPLRICWSGLHLPGKALHLLLRAVAALPSDVEYQIDILGDGPCNREWRVLAEQLHIDNYCHWYGRLPRNEALGVMQSCHVLAITSLKELTSTVAMEGLALGLPIICLNHCGMADLVTEECGIKIEPGPLSGMISGFALAIKQLWADEGLRWKLVQGALKHREKYSWQSKMDNLARIYGMALESNGCNTADLVAGLTGTLPL